MKLVLLVLVLTLQLTTMHVIKQTSTDNNYRLLPSSNNNVKHTPLEPILKHTHREKRSPLLLPGSQILPLSDTIRDNVFRNTDQLQILKDLKLSKTHPIKNSTKLLGENLLTEKQDKPTFEINNSMKAMQLHTGSDEWDDYDIPYTYRLLDDSIGDSTPQIPLGTNSLLFNTAPEAQQQSKPYTQQLNEYFINLRGQQEAARHAFQNNINNYYMQQTAKLNKLIDLTDNKDYLGQVAKVVSTLHGPHLSTREHKNSGLSKSEYLTSKVNRADLPNPQTSLQHNFDVSPNAQQGNYNTWHNIKHEPKQRQLILHDIKQYSLSPRILTYTERPVSYQTNVKWRPNQKNYQFNKQIPNNKKPLEFTETVKRIVEPPETINAAQMAHQTQVLSNSYQDLPDQEENNIVQHQGTYLTEQPYHEGLQQRTSSFSNDKNENYDTVENRRKNNYGQNFNMLAVPTEEKSKYSHFYNSNDSTLQSTEQGQLLILGSSYLDGSTGTTTKDKLTPKRTYIYGPSSNYYAEPDKSSNLHDEKHFVNKVKNITSQKPYRERFENDVASYNGHQLELNSALQNTNGKHYHESPEPTAVEDINKYRKALNIPAGDNKQAYFNNFNVSHFNKFETKNTDTNPYLNKLLFGNVKESSNAFPAMEESDALATKIHNDSSLLIQHIKPTAEPVPKIEENSDKNAKLDYYQPAPIANTLLTSDIKRQSNIAHNINNLSHLETGPQVLGLEVNRYEKDIVSSTFRNTLSDSGITDDDDDENPLKSTKNLHFSQNNYSVNLSDVSDKQYPEKAASLIAKKTIPNNTNLEKGLVSSTFQEGTLHPYDSSQSVKGPVDNDDILSDLKNLPHEIKQENQYPEDSYHALAKSTQHPRLKENNAHPHEFTSEVGDVKVEDIPTTILDLSTFNHNFQSDPGSDGADKNIGILEQRWYLSTTEKEEQTPFDNSEYLVEQLEAPTVQKINQNFWPMKRRDVPDGKINQLGSVSNQDETLIMKENEGINNFTTLTRALNETGSEETLSTNFINQNLVSLPSEKNIESAGTKTNQYHDSSQENKQFQAVKSMKVAGPNNNNVKGIASRSQVQLLPDNNTGSNLMKFDQTSIHQQIYNFTTNGSQSRMGEDSYTVTGNPDVSPFRNSNIRETILRTTIKPGFGGHVMKIPRGQEVSSEQPPFHFEDNLRHEYLPQPHYQVQEQKVTVEKTGTKSLVPTRTEDKISRSLQNIEPVVQEFIQNNSVSHYTNYYTKEPENSIKVNQENLTYVTTTSFPLIIYAPGPIAITTVHTPHLTPLEHTQENSKAQSDTVRFIPIESATAIYTLNHNLNGIKVVKKDSKILSHKPKLEVHRIAPNNITVENKDKFTATKSIGGPQAHQNVLIPLDFYHRMINREEGQNTKPSGGESQNTKNGIDRSLGVNVSRNRTPALVARQNTKYETPDSKEINNENYLDLAQSAEETSRTSQYDYSDYNDEDYDDGSESSYSIDWEKKSKNKFLGAEKNPSSSHFKFSTAKDTKGINDEVTKKLFESNMKTARLRFFNKNHGPTIEHHNSKGVISARKSTSLPLESTEDQQYADDSGEDSRTEETKSNIATTTETQQPEIVTKDNYTSVKEKINARIKNYETKKKAAAESQKNTRDKIRKSMKESVPLTPRYKEKSSTTARNKQVTVAPIVKNVLDVLHRRTNKKPRDRDQSKNHAKGDSKGKKEEPEIQASEKKCACDGKLEDSSKAQQRSEYRSKGKPSKKEPHESGEEKELKAPKAKNSCSCGNTQDLIEDCADNDIVLARKEPELTKYNILSNFILWLQENNSNEN